MAQLHLCAQVEVQRSRHVVERRVGARQHRAAVLLDEGERILLLLEGIAAVEGIRRRGCRLRDQEGLVPRRIQRREARIADHRGIVGVERGAEGGGDVEHPRQAEEIAHVRVADAARRAGVCKSEAGGGGDVGLAVHPEGQPGQHVVRGNPDAHVAVRDLHRAELPVVLQAHVGLHHVVAERLAARQFPLSRAGIGLTAYRSGRAR